MLVAKKEQLEKLITKDWYWVLSDYFKTPDFSTIIRFLNKRYEIENQIFPEKHKIFSDFKKADPFNTNLVIVYSDSTEKVYDKKELSEEIANKILHKKIKISKNDLFSQKVILINTCITVENNLSLKRNLWHNFIKAVLNSVTEGCPYVTVLLLGKENAHYKNCCCKYSTVFIEEDYPGVPLKKLVDLEFENNKVTPIKWPE